MFTPRHLIITRAPLLLQTRGEQQIGHFSSIEESTSDSAAESEFSSAHEPQHLPESEPSPEHPPELEPSPEHPPELEPSPEHLPESEPLSVRLPELESSPEHPPELEPSLEHLPDLEPLSGTELSREFRPRPEPGFSREFRPRPGPGFSREPEPESDSFPEPMHELEASPESGHQDEQVPDLVPVSKLSPEIVQELDHIPDQGAEPAFRLDHTPEMELMSPGHMSEPFSELPIEPSPELASKTSTETAHNLMFEQTPDRHLPSMLSVDPDAEAHSKPAPEPSLEPMREVPESKAGLTLETMAGPTDKPMPESTPEPTPGLIPEPTTERERSEIAETRETDTTTLAPGLTTLGETGNGGDNSGLRIVYPVSNAVADDKSLGQLVAPS